MIRPDDRTPEDRRQDAILSAEKERARERLLDRRNVLMNNFGFGSVADGMSRQAIESIDRRLAELDQ